MLPHGLDRLVRKAALAADRAHAVALADGRVDVRVVRDHLEAEGLRALGDRAANAKALIFNVKGEDLMWLDTPNARLTDADREDYRRLGLPAGPVATRETFPRRRPPPLLAGAVLPPPRAAGGSP